MKPEDREALIDQRRKDALLHRQKEPFQSFEQLAFSRTEHEDFRRVTRIRNSDVAIIAPHAGNLEQGTSEIARLVAGEKHNLYLFEALRNDWGMHITSHRFDDEVCLELIRDCPKVLAIHGCIADFEAVFLGGRDTTLMRTVRSALREAGITVYKDRVHLGRRKTNVCNRGAGGAGVQLEFSLPLRERIIKELAEAPEGGEIVRGLIHLRDIISAK